MQYKEKRNKELIINSVFFQAQLMKDLQGKLVWKGKAILKTQFIKPKVLSIK